MSLPEHTPSQESPDRGRWFVEEVLPAERPLRAYLSRSLPSSADVDDVVQDSYVRLLKAKEKGPVHKTKAFLFAIARNVVRDWLHRKSTESEVPITENEGEIVIQSGDSVVEFVSRQQELTLLQDAIQSLPERCREVVVLRKLKGYSQKEIARMLGITENTVESLAAKGVRRCAEYLRKQGVGDLRDHV